MVAISDGYILWLFGFVSCHELNFLSIQKEVPRLTVALDCRDYIFLEKSAISSADLSTEILLLQILKVLYFLARMLSVDSSLSVH